MYNIKYITGPTCRGPAQCTCSPWTYKRESTPARIQALSDSLETKGTQAIQHTVDVGYYALKARTTLNRLCSSCSSTKIEHSLTASKHILHLGLGGCIPPPGCGFPRHDTPLNFRDVRHRLEDDRHLPPVAKPPIKIPFGMGSASLQIFGESIFFGEDDTILENVWPKNLFPGEAG